MFKRPLLIVLSYVVLIALAGLFGDHGWPLVAMLAALGALLALERENALSRQLARSLKGDEERRFLDEQLMQSQKLAAVGQLSAGIAHEINNPMAIIGQEAELLERLLAKTGQLDPGDAREGLSEIKRQVNRCRDITGRLLHFARKMRPIRQEADLRGVVEDMALLVEKEAALKGVRIVRDYDQAPVLARTDPPLLRQAILNLLNNAYQAALDGAEPREIRVKVRQAGRFADIEVADTGPGIAGENLERIFEPFFTTKQPGEGTGLGLSIAHNIIARLGGTLRAGNRPGRGAVFTIRLDRLLQPDQLATSVAEIPAIRNE